MVGQHLRTGVEIGDGARHFEDATVGTSTQTEALHGRLKQFDSRGIGLGILMNHALGHLCIAVNGLVGAEALGLNFARLHHPFADGGTGFARRCTTDVGKRHGRYLALDVDAVEQRPRDFVHVVLNLPRRAHAMVGWIAVIAARTGVHAGHKHERTRERDVVFCAADGYHSVLQWLPQHL